MYFWVSEICAEGIFVTFPWWLKNVKSRSKTHLFFKWAPFWKLISKKRTITFFSEVNYLNYTKRPNFACGIYIFPETRGNKNKPWTHSTPLKRWYGCGPMVLSFDLRLVSGFDPPFSRFSCRCGLGNDQFFSPLTFFRSALNIPTQKKFSAPLHGTSQIFIHIISVSFGLHGFYQTRYFVAQLGLRQLVSDWATSNPFLDFEAKFGLHCKNVCESFTFERFVKSSSYW